MTEYVTYAEYGLEVPQTGGWLGAAAEAGRVLGGLTGWVGGWG